MIHYIRFTPDEDGKESKQVKEEFMFVQCEYNGYGRTYRLHFKLNTNFIVFLRVLLFSHMLFIMRVNFVQRKSILTYLCRTPGTQEVLN